MIVDENNNFVVIRVFDSDKEVNFLLVYKILDLEVLKFFKIDFSMGILIIILKMDYESMFFF